uniref:RING-type E3 ubiquitin transferase n=1 Tax=Anthurium amnicola TaxID=1678845 RepID=A0A1D1Y1L2_9ARAE
MEVGRMVQRNMDTSEIEESLFSVCDAKLHGGMCKKLSSIVCKVLAIFPVIEAARPRSKSGIQALCSLHVALDKAKNLLHHCSDCSKFYLAITGESVLLKFEKARHALQESLRGVEDIVPQSIGCQIMEIVSELEGTVFTLDHSEKQVGDEVIQLLQKERKFSGNSNDTNELEIFHQAATKLGITSSRAALTERRALKKLLERARAEEDKRKESIVAYLLHLMRKYSKLFRSDFPDDTDSQGSAPCSPTVLGTLEENSGPGGNGQGFQRQLSKGSSLNLKPTGIRSGSMPMPPEELRCPISLQLMYDPVIISSGQTYERACIEKWFNDGHSTCPKTQQQLSHLCLTPNYCVKGLIASWCEQNGLSVPEGPPESLYLNYWRLALSECEATDSRSVGSIDSCKLKDVKVVPLEENGIIENLEGAIAGNLKDSCYPVSEVAEFQRHEKLLSMLCEGKNLRKKCKAVEQMRSLLKDDEETRIYMGANGFVEALVQFLTLAIDAADDKSQEVGAMALFNLAVNNNRNKGMILSAGIISLLEEMIQNSTYEAATALYLNLSCLDEAKAVIGSSKAVVFLVQLLRANYAQVQCKADALHALYNLSTHPPNIHVLLSAGVVAGLHSLIIEPSGPEGSTWVEKSIAIFMNLASSKSGKKEIASTPGLISALATLLDTGEPAEQEQAVACLYVLCHGDQRCSHLVLQEGVIPALVSLSVNGTPRAKEKAQKLLALFREQRQREPSPLRLQQHAEGSGDAAVAADGKPLCKLKSKKLGWTLSSMWKNKNFSVYQC